MQENLEQAEFTANPTPNYTREQVVGSIPRRRPLVTAPIKAVPLPQYRRHVDFDSTLLLTAKRSLQWAYAILAFVLGILRDKYVPGYKDNDERRAQRLYHIFKNLGGAFIKIGQQLGIRIDIMPFEYYTALSRLLDEVPPFDFDITVQIIEKNVGKPFGEIFSKFDPDPVGSGSIACVYQAILREDGAKVAVKVRRPGIGEMIAADFDIIRNLFLFLRFVNLLPKFVAFETIDELHDILMEELDFVWEARHQDMFSQFAGEIDFCSAPSVYFEYSSEDVIVQEFVTGIPLKDLLALVENKDEAGLAQLVEYNIDPEIVARRLLWVNYYTLWNTLFFHADPHPGNIIVLTNNELVFVDFGAVGSLGNKLRWALQQVFQMEANGNVEGAARIALTLMEPLPPIDLDKLLTDVKFEFQRAAVALSSRGVPWTERTTAQLWFGFFRVARKYGVSVPPATVRMIRGTMLYDTLAARLYPEINIIEEYRYYQHHAGKASRERIKGAVFERARSGGLIPEDFARIEQLLKEGEQLVYQAQRFVNNVQYSTLPLLGKFTAIMSYILSLVIRLLSIWLIPPTLGFSFFFLELLFYGPVGASTRFVDIGPQAFALTQTHILFENWYWILTVTLTLINLIVSGQRFFASLYRLDNDE